jgi:DNA (cytosine-5)-methyltransferase 1
MRFIDLFAGLGGFHLALDDLGHDCVFASEIDQGLRDLYKRNFHMECKGDIRDIKAEEIPDHEILCAGFPCQPFSKAGPQDGLDHPELGDLYLQILKVIRLRKPKYLILENVPNLERHGNGNTWKVIKGVLEREKYNVEVFKVSPDDFGIPQIRNRIYIVGSKDPIEVAKRLNLGRKPTSFELKPFLNVKPFDARPIPEYLRQRLAIWQEFLDLLPKDAKIPHPVWAMEFGATYPYQRTTPSQMSTFNLRRYRGSFGRELSEGRSRTMANRLLPSHAKRKQRHFPKWKVQFISKNRSFYKEHKSLLKDWLQKVEKLPPSFQKFEWNVHAEDPKREDRRLNQYVIQARPSGIRVKRPTTAPSLVAMNATQVPMIMWEERFMTPTEGKLLQSMEKLRYLPESDSKAYRALGNAVNVRVARRVALALVGKASPAMAPLDERQTHLPSGQSIVVSAGPGN